MGEPLDAVTRRIPDRGQTLAFDDEAALRAALSGVDTLWGRRYADELRRHFWPVSAG